MRPHNRMHRHNAGTDSHTHTHTYGPHPHVRRRKPEASRVLHFYSALSFFPSDRPSPSRLPPPRVSQRAEPVNERAHNQPPYSSPLSSHPLPTPSLRRRRWLATLAVETVFHIQNVLSLSSSRSPTRHGGLIPRLQERASWRAYLRKEYKTWIVRGTAYILHICIRRVLVYVRASARPRELVSYGDGPSCARAESGFNLKNN